MTLENLILFLGWCSVINIGLLLLTSLILILINNTLAKWHATLFNIDENLVRNRYFQYLSQYKILIIVFNIVPYFALKFTI
jgi:hypothetical protein